MSSRKKIFFYIFLVVICYITAETFAFASHWLVTGKIFSWKTYQAERLDVILETPIQLDPNNNPVVLHPYLGYVAAPKNDKISEFGFFGESQDAPFTPRKTGDNLIVGVFGGSFANEATLNSHDALRKKIQAIPQFRDKEIIIHSIALGGYKQPQQASALMYLLLMGCCFDIVINLDGFNEVALPPITNLPNRVNPFFPRNWFGKTAALKDPGVLILLKDLSRIQKRQQFWAEVYENSPLQHSVAANILWKSCDRRYERLRNELEAQLNTYQATKEAELDYVVTGPPFSYRNTDELYEELSSVWKNASLQMHRLCQANGIDYFHFLQPNQYVAHSKIIETEEACIAFDENNPYHTGAMKGYPHLIQEGKTLQKQGVNYYDLTMLFSSISAPLYRDSCCHLNNHGYDIVAARIGDILQNYYR